MQKVKIMNIGNYSCTLKCQNNELLKYYKIDLDLGFFFRFKYSVWLFLGIILKSNANIINISYSENPIDKNYLNCRYRWAGKI